jgi:16S rRNA (guanine527-N7)-methyltransferase
MESTLPQHTREPIARYLDLLDRWSQTHALTSLENEERFEELILDSAIVLPYLQPLPAGSRIVDFGTGMGIPAVLIALARPDLTVIALDKSNKKISFVRQAAMELRIPNLQPLAGRAEQLPPLLAHVGVAKAVGSLDLLAGWWRRHGLPGAPFLALKGPQEAGSTLAAPSPYQIQLHPYQLPTRGHRTLVELTPL